LLHTSLGCEDLATSFQRAAKAGAEGVEVRYAAHEVARLAEREHAEELRDLAKCHGLAIPSLCLAFLCREPSLLEPPEEVARAQEAVGQAVALAGKIGAGTVVLPFFGNSAIELEEEIHQAADAVIGLVEDAEQAGVVLGLETNLSFGRQRFLLDCMGSPPGAKIYHDTARAAARKLDLPTGIRDLGSEGIAGIHFGEVRTIDGSPPEFNLALGEGDVDFRAVVQALKAIRYDGWIVLETPPGDDALKSARANLALIRNLIAQ